MSTLTTDRIAELYEKHAHALDSARRKSFAERHWLDRFVLPLRRPGHILDLGCGAGEPIDRYLADMGFSVMGVDLSERMVALARLRFPRQRWLKTDMRRALMERPYDGILAWDSFYHLTGGDQAQMIGRIASWLKAGGAFLFNTSPPKDDPFRPFAAGDLYQPSLPVEKYRALFEANDLAEIAHVPKDPHTGDRDIWLVRKLHRSD
jgi:cyclopropane fatty-acyl-phospholipid synthase-like methyltransferase